MMAKYPVKIQTIRSKERTDRFYVFVPLPLAAAIGLQRGEEVQWTLTDKDTLCWRRLSPTPPASASPKVRKGEPPPE
jgi:hypothetical protein